MRLTAFFKLYEMCTLLHRFELNMLAKNLCKRSAIFVKFQRSEAHRFQRVLFRASKMFTRIVEVYPIGASSCKKNE